MTNTDEAIEGASLREISILLYPTYVRLLDGRSLVGRELLVYDEDAEVHRRTTRGDNLVEAIRAAHGLHFVDDSGGGRWHLNGRGLHCGEAVEILLDGGTWLPVRFEVVRSDASYACKGRLPRFYIAAAGGTSLKGGFDHEQWRTSIFRWPPRLS